MGMAGKGGFKHRLPVNFIPHSLEDRYITEWPIGSLQIAAMLGCSERWFKGRHLKPMEEMGVVFYFKTRVGAGRFDIISYPSLVLRYVVLVNSKIYELNMTRKPARVHTKNMGAASKNMQSTYPKSVAGKRKADRLAEYLTPLEASALASAEDVFVAKALVDEPPIEAKRPDGQRYEDAGPWVSNEPGLNAGVITRPSDMPLASREVESVSGVGGDATVGEAARVNKLVPPKG